MENIDKFNVILSSYKIKAVCVDYKSIDNYFYYDVKLSASGKVKDLQKFSEEISLALKTPCKPSVKSIPDEGVVRLEFAGPRKTTLDLFSLFEKFEKADGEIPCLLGQTVDGTPIWMDLAANPHMIVAGTTGSGKSTLMHNLIANVLKNKNTKLFLVDPKNIEFSKYEACNNDNIEVRYTFNSTIELLDELIATMEHRYICMRNGAKASNFPSIVVMIDEFADLIMQDQDNSFYEKVCRLAQKSRAAKIHFIIGTQRPSVNIINGTIKANFPARIACRVASHVDSKVILDSAGAENLFGKGDALLKDNFRYLERFQIAFTTPEEVCEKYSK